MEHTFVSPDHAHFFSLTGNFPAWLPSLIEGLLADNGASAQLCEDIKENPPATLQRLRKMANLNPVEFAASLKPFNVPCRFISMWERGVSCPTGTEMHHISCIYGQLWAAGQLV